VRRATGARDAALILVAGWLPGALLGAHFGLLLFSLNPRLPTAAPALARASAVYALLFGAAGTLLIVPWTRTRQRALRLLPWTLTAALGVATALVWIHVSRYAYFLPAGINERWIKGAIRLSILVLIGFYTALLHAVAKRPYGIRSRLAFWFIALSSLFVVIERRLAYVPPPPPAAQPARALVEPASPPTRLLVIGLDTATLDALLPLAEQGTLPFFRRMMEQGSFGQLSSLRPNRRAPLWATLSTGKLPYKHSVVGARIWSAPLLGRDSSLELLPVAPWGLLAHLGGSERRVDRRQLGALTLWELLARLGISTGVVGWPLSAPVASAEPESLRFLLGDSYFSGSGPTRQVSAWPSEIEARARLFRLRGSDLDPAQLIPFGSPPADGVAEALARDQWRASLARFLLDQPSDVDALFIRLPGLGEVTDRYFGGFLAAEFEGRQRAPYDAAAQAVRAYYGWLDATLAGLWEQRGGGVMAIVSAYGAESANGWRWVWAEMSRKRSLEADFHRSPDGALLLLGDGVQPHVRLSGARLVDVMPTLLYALGLPIARDLDGRVLRDAFDPAFLANHPLAFVPSYDPLAAEPAAPP
jgi:hypothetical protein